MGKTVNRMPASVDLPTSKQVKNYFFNHYNWKGLNDDKNFLSVDQETFSDCNNIYVDTEGLLKSRPSLKLKVVTYTNTGEIYTLANIIDVWTFDEVTVYKTYNNNIYYLTFISSKYDNHIQKALQYEIENIDGSKTKANYADVKLVVADRKIFVFSEYAFDYYDMDNNIYSNADKFIHIPVRSTITNNIASSKTEVESPNILTSSYIKKYIYSKVNNEDKINVKFDSLIGKTITVNIDNDEYTITFVKDNELVFVNKYTSLTDVNYSDKYILGKDGAGVPLVEISDSTSVLVSSYDYTLSENAVPTINWTIYHTVDGDVFEKLPTITGVIGTPKLSRDGIYAFVFKSDGPYVISVVASEGTSKKYTTWKNLLNSINATQYAELNLNINKINTVDSNFNQSTVVNGYFIDDKAFAFTYGSGNVLSNGDPIYNNLYCIYCNGDANIHKEQIFGTDSNGTTAFTLTPVNASTTVDKVKFDVTSTGNLTNGVYTQCYSNNTYNIVPAYTSNIVIQGYTVNITAALNISYYKQIKDIYSEYYAGGIKYISRSIDDTAINIQYDVTMKLIDTNGKSLQQSIVSYSKDFDKFYVPVEYSTTLTGHKYTYDHIIKWNNVTLELGYFNITITAEKVNTLLDGSTVDYLEYSEKLQISYNAINGEYSSIGKQLLVDDNAYFAYTTAVMPNVYANNNANKFSIAIDFVANLQNRPSNLSSYYRAIYSIEPDNVGTTVETSIGKLLYTINIYETEFAFSVPIKDNIFITNNSVTNYYYICYNVVIDDTQCVVLYVAKSDGNTATNIINALRILYKEQYLSRENFLNQIVKISYPNAYIITNKYLLQWPDYNKTYEFIPLLFEAKPVGYYDDKNLLFLVANNILYHRNLDNTITLEELIKGKTNYFLPSLVTQLDNYYFAKGNTLYISQSTNSEKFEWYIPEKSKQEFDYTITNLHPISNTDVAIFFENSVSYVTRDTDLKAYRYTKSKLQNGCKVDSDVITTFDGKYTLFPSDRGLVAMSYQEFMATTEQALSYLSDAIFSIFKEYINEQLSLNHIKLFKFEYWIFVYKPDSNKVLLFDIRNNSWWPLSCNHKVKKFVNEQGKLKVLLDNNMYNINTDETYYFDNDGKKRKIEWFIQSQKLHFNAINYYKHIINITFTSVHNKEVLENFNVDSSSIKLQVNNYRKSVTGNIGDDDYIPVVYTIDSARTYVQRVNYYKVNEFQYLLSSNEENAIDIPLSLNSITVKYKIGNQVR